MTIKERGTNALQVHLVRNGERVRKDFSFGDGKKFRTKAAARTAAERHERDVLAKWDRGEGVSMVSPLCRDFAKEFLSVYAKANNKPSEQKQKQMILDLHILPRFGDMRLDRITAAEIEKTKAIWMRDGAKPKTVRNRLAILRKMLVVAADWGQLASVPVMKFPRAQAPKFRYHDEAEAEALIAAVPEAMRPMVVTAYRTGLRRGELLALRWEDIDFKAKILEVRRSVWEGELGPPKSGKSRRVPLSSWLIAVLRELPSRFPGTWVFPGGSGGMLGTGEIQQALKVATKTTGIATNWHAWRHSFASASVMRGVPLRVVQEWLGHGTIAMTEKYAHLAPGFANEMIDRLDGPVGSVGSG